MKNLKIILFILITAINHGNAFAQKPAVVLSDKDGWHKIGETTVDFKTDTDEILVIGANRFKSVKIKVIDAPVNLKSFDIYFDKGDIKNVTIGKEIKAPGETTVVQLKDNEERIVKKVVFTYNTTSNDGKKAHIELWGLKTNADKKNKY